MKNWEAKDQQKVVKKGEKNAWLFSLKTKNEKEKEKKSEGQNECANNRIHTNNTEPMAFHFFLGRTRELGLGREGYESTLTLSAHKSQITLFHYGGPFLLQASELQFFWTKIKNKI